MTSRTLPFTSLPATGPLSPALSRRAALRSALALPALAVGLSACTTGGDEDEPSSDTPGTSVASSSSATGAASDAVVTVTDPWVKAADSGMTAAFGIVRNGTAAEVTLVSVSSAAASDVQLHQTASNGSGGMSMEQKEGGFPIPAGGELALEPGADHIMLMGLTSPLLPGDQVEMTLEFADGTELPVTATVKDFAGAQENYEGMEHPSDGGGHGHEEEHR